MITDSTAAMTRERLPVFWAAFTRPRTFLPQEHGGWFLFFAPLVVGLAIGRVLNGAVLAFALAALAVFLVRQPLDLALKAIRNQRPRNDLPALVAWIAIEGTVIALAGGYLLFAAARWGLLVVGVLGAGFLAAQVWAGQARQTRTAWSEVLGTAGLSVVAGAGYYVATGAWSVTALVLWLLCAAQSVGGVLYSRWRLRRRRLAAKGGSQHGVGVPRVSVLTHYAASLIVALLVVGLGWAPWPVIPLYLLLLGRVFWGTRPAAAPDATVKAVGLSEGLVMIFGAAWLIAAFALVG